MEEIFEVIFGIAALSVPLLIIVGFVVSVLRDDEDEDKKRSRKIQKRIEKDEKMVRIDSFHHGAKKLFKLKKQVEARIFSIKCFKYIRSVLFALGAFLAISFFDVPVEKGDLYILQVLLKILIPFVCLTFSLYLLSLLYFPLCKAVYYLIHKKDVIPYKSSGNMARDTKKMYKDAEKIHKKASTLWSDWWDAFYVKRSRILKIATALGCGCVVFLKGYFDVGSNLHTFFEEHGLFAEKMLNENIISLCAIIIGFELVVYFLLWIVFYCSDKMILATQIRDSAVCKCKKFEEKFYKYWVDNDPVEYKKFWDKVNKHAQEREAEERRRRDRVINNSDIQGSSLTEAEAWHATQTMMGGNSIDTTGM